MATYFLVCDPPRRLVDFQLFPVVCLPVIKQQQADNILKMINVNANEGLGLAAYFMCASIPGDTVTLKYC